LNFDHYTDREVALAASLVNTALPDVAALAALLDDLGISSPGRLTRTVLEQVCALQPRLRLVFETGDERVAAEQINALLAEAPALPQLTNHDGEPWHLHVAGLETPLAARLAAESAMGLAVVLRDEGISRLKRCENPDCSEVFVDTSRNRSRRYCDPRACGNRANVAAYRARRRVEQSDEQ
jgi:predicted RNA-binding Zn ribbon-like protein